MNARVEDKSGEELINIISKNVNRMLRRKMDAVTCIRIAAEETVESWNLSFENGNSYISSKCSHVDVIGRDSAKKKKKKKKKLCERDIKYKDMYR